MNNIYDFFKIYNENNIITDFFPNEIINQYVPMSNPDSLDKNSYYLWCNKSKYKKFNNENDTFIQLDDNIIYIIVANVFNHYHHNFTEIVMILQIYLNYFENININNYSFKIISSKCRFIGNQMSEILKLFDFENKIIWIEDDKFYKGNFLYIKHVDGISNVPHGLGYVKPCLPRNKSTIFVELIRKANEKYNGTPFYKKIWISRRDLVGNWNKRILTNINDIAEYIINLDFQEIFFNDSFDFLYQIYLVNNAELIFGEFGTGLINMLFCKEETTIITFFCPSNYMMCTFYEEMGSIINLKYYLYKNCIDDIESNLHTGSDWNEPYKIENIEDFKKWIFNILHP